MVTLLVPPARRSISACGAVQGCGAHHCLSSSGSDQARNTLARGASMMRVSTSSRSEEDVAAVMAGSVLSLWMPRGRTGTASPDKRAQSFSTEFGEALHRPPRRGLQQLLQLLLPEFGHGGGAV